MNYSIIRVLNVKKEAEKMRVRKMLLALAIEVDGILGDFVRGDWCCPTAAGYGRYVPCGGGNCFFCSYPYKYIGII
jgi:uncharacterized hydantoinase/oxoprolinase family protein